MASTERTTGFEPATPTLARLCATSCATSAWCLPGVLPRSYPRLPAPAPSETLADGRLAVPNRVRCRSPASRTTRPSRITRPEPRRPAAPRPRPPGRSSCSSDPELSSTTSATARRCSSEAWAAIRARAVSESIPRPASRRSRSSSGASTTITASNPGRQPALHQQRDVLHHRRRPAGSRLGGQLLAAGPHQRVHDRVQVRQRRRVAEHQLPEPGPVQAAVGRQHLRSRTAPPPGPAPGCPPPPPRGPAGRSPPAPRRARPAGRRPCSCRCRSRRSARSVSTRRPQPVPLGDAAAVAEGVVRGGVQHRLGQRRQLRRWTRPSAASASP